ncbi:MAG: glycine--tRNA ligase subunit beta [Thermoanaerobaculia bacterium]
MSQKKEYFFELLAEEIPAWMLESRLATLTGQLRTLVTDFTGSDPASDAILADATSRRIFFRISGLPEKQADRDEEVKGPPAKVAYDDHGNPTPAMLGFLRKNGATINDLSTHDDYVWLRRSVKGLTAAEVLAARIPKIIEGLRWPKMMRWGRPGNSWIRPVHSVVSIFDGAPVPIEIFGIASGTTTRGHRILDSREIELTGYEDYVRRMEEAHVIVHADERVRRMRDASLTLASEVGGVPARDETIWEQWRFLTEYPGLVRAEFDSSFLELPEEVLITVMRVHQKQLPIRSEESLTHSFLAVMDNDADRDGNAASGNAFVTNARFADAHFFYRTDRKRPLIERLSDLEHLQFQEKLGNYREKTDRMKVLAEKIRAESGSAAKKEMVQNAAELAKVDLPTEMVKEFTDLQGRIGGIYAREEGYSEEVWQAIYDHYSPVSVDDPLPRSEVGAIVSLADRLDTLAGFFLIGLEPSGSKDPFALRRAAQGAVQILLNRDPWQLPLDVSRLIDFAIEGYQIEGSDPRETREHLVEFIAERVRTLLESVHGFAYDEIAAAMAAGWTSSLTDLQDRVAALRQVRRDPLFLSILDSAKRIDNITGDATSTAVDAGRFVEPAEKRLYELSRLVGEQVDDLAAHGKYASGLESFAGLAPEIEKFFDEVMVMVDDLEVRKNRFALLRNVGTIARRIADVTRIVVDRKGYESSES